MLRQQQWVIKGIIKALCNELTKRFLFFSNKAMGISISLLLHLLTARSLLQTGYRELGDGRFIAMGFLNTAKHIRLYSGLPKK